MSSESFDFEGNQDLKSAFPEVDPGQKPLGARVMVQLKRVSNKSAGGLILVEETKDTVKANVQIAKIVELGPLAFKNRESATPWPEGMWVSVGDFVRIPRWGGDRVEVEVEGDKDNPVVFVVLNDHELITKVTKNPLGHKAYIL